jgi:hypothetical protein
LEDKIKEMREEEREEVRKRKNCERRKEIILRRR